MTTRKEIVEREGTYHDTSLISKRRLRGDKQAKFATLQRMVIETGLCSACCACVASCPENALEMVEGQPTLVGRCTACGICLHQCPKTKTTVEQLIGNVEAIYKGKTALPELLEKRQDGGVVTSLLIYLLREKLVDGAIVTKKSDEEHWKPEPTLVTTEEELLESSGSIYCQSSAVGKLLESIKAGYHALAFVGTPCNIDAITKMQNSPYGVVRLFMRSNILKIGLFCMDAFDYERLIDYLRNKDIEITHVSKMQIQKGQFIVESGEENKSWPIHEMDHIRKSSCMLCTDLTSENADISVGSVGSPKGYNTVIARSGLGREILEDAAENGYLELEILTKPKKAVLNLAGMKKVQLYAQQRRRSFVFSSPPKDTVSVIAELTAVEEEKAPTKAKRKRNIIRVESTTRKGDTIAITLRNRRGKIIESARIHIGYLSEDGLLETESWVINANEWFPGEHLEFEFPYRDQEFIVDIRDGKEKLLTKRIPPDRVE
ncbi:MAG: Coenzyme F420 hydrogenase/dehydrogenase, beta subunit C-terminal domain [Promethearchaeota archaeon]